MVSLRTSVAIALSRDFPGLDGGWPIFRAALEAERCDPALVAWDDRRSSWDGFDAVLVNYCWGYVAKRDAFLLWADTVSEKVQVVNSSAMLRWNSSKTYLRDLASAGVAIVPTTFVEPGPVWEPPGRDYVIKPAVSSGSLGAARYVESDIAVARAHLHRLHASGQTVVVQPYQASVDVVGETAMLFIGCKFSHAIRKGPLLRPDVGEIDALWEREVIEPITPRVDQLELAMAALEVVAARFGVPTYARVDSVDDDAGRPAVLEVELIEPSLFLPLDGLAARRLARELRSRIVGA